MKKIIASLILLGSVSSVSAADLITSTLLDHVMTVTQFQSGETRLALMDSIVQIGAHDGKSIFDLQVGLNGNTKPEPGEVQAANLVAGGFLKFNSFTGLIKFPAHWEFLNGIEHGPAVYYDFRQKDWEGGYQVGLAFDLAPKK